MDTLIQELVELNKQLQAVKDIINTAQFRITAVGDSGKATVALSAASTGSEKVVFDIAIDALRTYRKDLAARIKATAIQIGNL